MAKHRRLSPDQVVEIKAARKTNKDKNIERRLLAVELRGAGFSYKEIAEKTGFAASYVGELIKKYCENGLTAITENHYKGNHRLLSFDEEADLLKPFVAKAEKGQLVTIKEIEEAYIVKAGKVPSSNSHIYLVLKRHNFRKVMPRSKHPNKASDAVIHNAKKLNQLARN